jgi:hypothetical protein
VSTQERIGHTAGRYPERFHNKCAEHKRQDKGRYEPLKGIANLRYPVSSFATQLTTHLYLSLLSLEPLIGTTDGPFIAAHTGRNYAGNRTPGQQSISVANGVLM